nr:class I SAM-dependent methyltransferase [uncultured Methanobacterium sp.]
MKPECSKTERVHLTKEKETLLITLYAKALDNRSEKPILSDQKADEMVKAIDYDFEKLIPPEDLNSANLVVIRAKQIDTWIEEFLKTYPNVIVLNLGCGLDTRVSRINPSKDVCWFDVDYPEVINLRKRFYSNQENYQMVKSSLTELRWLEKIPNNKPVMVVAEGVLEYLTEYEVKTLLNRLTDHFSHGQIIFDVMNSFAIESGQKSLKKTTGAEHKWAVDDIQKVDVLNSKLKRISSLSIMGSKFMHKLPLKYRLIYKIMYLIPNFRNMIRLLSYSF